MEKYFNNAIGVFDSGVGGISVLKKISEILPDEKVVYCADSKNVPWSEKSEEFLLERINTIIIFY
jgi:glutamate racemase